MDLNAVAELYQRGLLLQAYRASQSLGPLQGWRGVEERILAGRLARQLGATRLAHRLFMLAVRADRRAPGALYYYAGSLSERRGPYAAWRFVSQRGDLASAARTPRADWLALHARLLAQLRDFERAEPLLARALDLEPERPWLHVEAAGLHASEDRLEAALASGRKALELQPWYVPAVSSVAACLIHLDRKDEALALLREGSERLEAAGVTGQLVNLLIDRERYDEAEVAIARLHDLLPLLDAPGRQWLDGLRSDVAYQRGDLARARELLRDATAHFQVHLRERLADGDPEAAAVRLPVPWVRQNHMTCGPATLASLGAFWSVPVHHDELANRISYGGTPDHVERHWAETNGWIVREFSVDWSSARALLERGVPFSFTTVHPTSAHLQAVVGYDARRGTLLIRDPSGFMLREYLAESFIDAFRSTGPRGMALVPSGEAARLHGLRLPDESLYDLVYRMKRALEVHRRESAEACWQALRSEHPDHPLTWRACWELALYDSDFPGALAAVDALLVRFPGDQTLLFRRIAMLRDLGHVEAAREAVEAALRLPHPDPVFLQQRGDLLRADARQWVEAETCLRRALEQNPHESRSYAASAGLRLAQQRATEALELQRFAACLSPVTEGPSQSFFWMAHVRGAPEEGLAFLRERVRRAQTRSSQPAQTLAWALCALDRRPEALAVLAEALAAHPEDGELLLAVALEHARAGEMETAEAHLERARGRAHAGSWLRTAADLSSLAGRAVEALERWRRASELEPIDEALARRIAERVALTEGADAARSYLRSVAERAPRNVGIQLLWAHWLAPHDRAQAIALARGLAARHPSSSPARRGLAELLLDDRQLAEAAEASREASSIDPRDARALALLARILLELGDREGAARAARDGIRLDVDTADAVHLLVETCSDDEARREALRFVHAELQRQVVFGDGIAAYRAAARVLFDPDHVLALVEEARAARPDLWPAWSESIKQLLEMERPAQALDLAEEATRRFPLVPGAWSDLALVHQLRSDRDGRRQALSQALEIAPAWAWAHRELAAEHRAQGQLDPARRCIERAIAAAPLDAANQVARAELLWAGGEREPALAAYRRAIELDPGDAWAWQQLRLRAAELGREDEAARLADALAAERPRDLRCWLAVYRENPGPVAVEKRLAALDAALGIDPRNSEANDARAHTLADAGRFDEALRACRPEAFGAAPPLELRGRAAWIAAQRGERSTAIAEMEALVSEAPGYAWGWLQIASWHAADKRWEQARAAARRFVQVAPGAPEAWQLLGRLCVTLGEKAEAQAAFSRAIDLGGDGWVAGLELFDLLLGERETEAAVEALRRVEPHAPRDEILPRRIHAACAYGDRDTALRFFRELCAVPGENLEPLERSARQLAAYGLRHERDRLLDGFLRDGAPSPRALRLCAQRCAERWRAPERTLVEAAQRGEVEPLAQYVESLAGQRKGPRLRKLVRRQRHLLRGDARLWGHVGYAFLQLGLGFELRAWMRDWRERRDARPWMLLNLAVALRSVDDFDAAGEVSRAALAIGRDHSFSAHSIWLALDAALAGRDDEAARRLDEVREPSDYYARLAQLARLMLAARDRTPGAGLRYDKLKREVGASRESLRRESAASVAYRRAIQAIARERDTRMARLRAALGRIP